MGPSPRDINQFLCFQSTPISPWRRSKRYISNQHPTSSSKQHFYKTTAWLSLSLSLSLFLSLSLSFSEVPEGSQTKRKRCKCPFYLLPIFVSHIFHHHHRHLPSFLSTFPEYLPNVSRNLVSKCYLLFFFLLFSISLPISFSLTLWGLLFVFTNERDSLKNTSQKKNFMSFFSRQHVQ